MKILMITPGIDPDNDVFGSINTMVKKLATKVDKLVIITPRPSEDVPANVRVIGIREGSTLSKYLRLNKAILSVLRHEKIDIIFTHMYLEFPIAAFPYAKLFRKPFATWYEHSSTPLKLKLVTLMVDRIFSASRHGYRLKSKKSIILGQYFDASLFKPSKKKDPNELLSVSRISRSKNLHTIINTIAKLDDKHIKFTIVGGALDAAGKDYLAELKELVKKLGMENQVSFIGHVHHKDVAKYYGRASIFINTSRTGSLDRTGIEAMGSGMLLLATNPAYTEVLEGYKHKEMFLCEESNLIDKLVNILKLPESKKKDFSKDMRQIAVDGHSLEHFTSRMTEEFQKMLSERNR